MNKVKTNKESDGDAENENEDVSGDHLQWIEAQVERREDVCNENIPSLIAYSSSRDN